jgi:hypothetical protein
MFGPRAFGACSESRNSLKIVSDLHFCHVTGEVSVYQYQSRFKRLLSGLDGQTEIDAAELARWQAEHQAINQRLLQSIG